MFLVQLFVLISLIKQNKLAHVFESMNNAADIEYY